MTISLSISQRCNLRSLLLSSLSPSLCMPVACGLGCVICGDIVVSILYFLRITPLYTTAWACASLPPRTHVFWDFPPNSSSIHNYCMGLKSILQLQRKEKKRKKKKTCVFMPSWLGSSHVLPSLLSLGQWLWASCVPWCDMLTCLPAFFMLCVLFGRTHTHTLSAILINCSHTPQPSWLNRRVYPKAPHYFFSQPSPSSMWPLLHRLQPYHFLASYFLLFSL